MAPATTIADVNAELTVRLRQQELATGFANFGLRTRSLQSILDEACRVAARGMGCALAKVLEHEPGENRFVMRAGVGWRPGLVGRATIGADLESPAGYAFRTGEPVLSNHLAAETRFRTPLLLVEHDVHRAFNVLVATDGRHYGVLEVDSPDDGDFSMSDAAFLENLAATLAHAIDRHRQVEELEEGRARLRAANEMLRGDVRTRTHERDHLWDMGQDLLAVGNAEGQLVNVNPYWTRLLGWEREELIGGPYAGKVHPEDLQVTLDAVEGMLATDGATLFECRMLARDGSWKWVSWSLSTASGTGLFTAVGRDGTALREQQRQLAQVQDSLRQSQKMEAVGQLTGGLAHDFNNLLTGVSGSLDMIARRIEQGRAAEVGRYVTLAREAATRAAALTHRLLAFSRRQTLDPISTDVDALVAGMADLVRRTVGPSVEIRVVPGREPGTALVDPNQLENALLNLCINARDAMPDGGRLLIERGQTRLDARDAGASDLPPGRLLDAERHRQRHGDAARGGGEGLRPLLHHQADRDGDRPRPVDDLRVRAAVGRSGAHPLATDARHHRDPPACPCTTSPLRPATRRSRCSRDRRGEARPCS